MRADSADTQQSCGRTRQHVNVLLKQAIFLIGRAGVQHSGTAASRRTGQRVGLLLETRHVQRIHGQRLVGRGDRALQQRLRQRER